MRFRRFITIGDIHGCREEHQELLAACGVTKDDCLIYLGDLLDKGPDGPGVVKDIREADEAGQPTVVVLGNHEATNIRYFAAQDRVNNPDDKITKNPVKDRTGDYLHNYQALSERDRQYLETKPVLAFQIPGTDYLVLHAGVNPGYKLPATKDLRWSSLGREDQGRAVIPLRVRFVREKEEVVVTTTTQTLIRGGQAELMDEPKVHTSVRKAGKMVSLGDEHESHMFWAALYNGRLGHIFFGHSAWAEDETPRKFQNATGLDLGCVFGGRLAAAIVTPHTSAHQWGGDVEYVTVKAKKVYNTRYIPTVLEDGYYRRP